MRYKYVIPTLCLFGTMSLYAEEGGLGDTLQEVAQKEKLIKPVPQKKKSQKKSRFVFHDAYDANGIALKEKSATKNKSENYNYENKSRFKFKFNNGSEQSNLVGRYGAGGVGGSMGSGYGGGQGAAGSGGHGGHGGGGRR
jgi:hypothetical protein